MDKAKIAKEVKHIEHEKRNRERGKIKRDSKPSNSVQWPKNQARFVRPPRVEVLAASTVVQSCGDYGMHHFREYWRSLGAYLRC